MHAEFPCLVACGGHDPAMAGLSPDNNGLASIQRIVPLFYRGKERVHVDVENGSEGHGSKNKSGGGRETRTPKPVRAAVFKTAGLPLS